MSQPEKYIKPPKTNLTDEQIIRRCHDAMINLGILAPHFLIVHSRVRHLYKVTRDDKHPTMGITKTGRIYVNADFAASLSHKELASVICHELMHLVLMHHQRTGIRDQKLFNVANDMVINHALRQEPMIQLPPWVLYPPEEYKDDLHSETLYDWLLDKQMKSKSNPGQGKGQGKGQGTGQGDGEGEGEGGQPLPGAGCGTMDDDPGDERGQPRDANGRPIDWRVVAAEMANTAQQMAMKAGENAGAGSSAIYRLLEPRNPRVKWTSVLRRGMSIAASKPGRDYQTMARRNRRSPVVGPQMPGWRGFSPTVCVIADVSGSMGEDFVNRLFSECKGMLKQFDGLEMFFITHTDRVEWSGWINRNTSERLKAAVQFTGGTNPDPAYELAKDTRRMFDTIVHFTDAEFFTATWPTYNAHRLVVGIYGRGGSCQPPPGSLVIPCFIDT